MWFLTDTRKIFFLVAKHLKQKNHLLSEGAKNTTLRISNYITESCAEEKDKFSIDENNFVCMHVCEKIWSVM